MQDFLNSKHKDEIDLRELFITLWAYKLFIAITCVSGIVFGGHYALNADKKFSSKAIFKLDTAQANSIARQGNFGALASLAGFNNLGGSLNLPVDQVSGRIFIEKLDTILKFKTDPYFNTYNPNRAEPTWKSLIKRIIGWPKSPINAQEAVWQSIVSKYKKNVTLGSTDDGSIKIVVTHVNAKRAAKIANVIMEEIINRARDKKDTQQDLQLSYLSNTLAKALSDLEISQSKLKEFTLKNSALPLESFATESLQLDALRDQLRRTSELHEAVAALLLMIQNNATNQANYMSLRQKFPIVDQVEFRRVLGQNEIISSWNWPEAKSVVAVFDTLTERKSRLQSQITASQIEAEQSSLSLETYARLERQANIANATYTVLIEQVKAQSMLSGYRVDNTEIYEYASASINPSEPKRNMILAVGAILGLFVGAVLSLFFANLRGVYHSKNSLKIGVQARFTATTKALIPLRSKSLKEIITILTKKPLPYLRNMAVGINKNATTQVVITSSRTKLTSNEVARVLSSYMQSNTMKIAIINFSTKAKLQTIEGEELSVGPFIVAESAANISVLRPESNLAALETLSHKDFWENIQSLDSTFDLVILCADNDDSISLLNALEGQKAFHITLARTNRTKSATLMHMRALLPIQGLFYD